MMRNRLSILYIFALSIAMVGLISRASAQSSPAPAAGPSPIATADGESPGTTLQVQELKVVSGGAVMMKFVLINNSDNAFGMSGSSALSADCCSAQVDAVTLIDLANKKKYEVIRDADKNCLCSRNLQNIPPKGSLSLYAKFPAPPDSVQKIEVNIPHFTPMEDVPISR
jgi:hypothetical protein